MIKASKHELSKCRGLMRRAGKRMSDLKSPTFDSQPKAVSYENGVERAMVRRIDAENELAYYVAAIEMCDKDCIKVIYDLYFSKDDDSRTEVIMNGNYNDRSFYRLERKALYQFAEAYRAGILFDVAAEKCQKSVSLLAE